MISVVRTPQGVELAEQVGLLVIELGGPQPVNGIGAGLLPNLEHLVADLIDRLFPADPHPFAPDQFGRVLQAPFAMAMLTHGCAFGAVCPQVKRVIESRLLANPHPVVHFSIDTATH